MQRSIQRKFEYPLVFDKHKWKAFRRSAYEAQRENESAREEPEDKKWFDALVKPKIEPGSVETLPKNESRQGAIFGSLPVYKV